MWFDWQARAALCSSAQTARWRKRRSTAPLTCPVNRAQTPYGVLLSAAQLRKHHARSRLSVNLWRCQVPRQLQLFPMPNPTHREIQEFVKARLDGFRFRQAARDFAPARAVVTRDCRAGVSCANRRAWDTMYLFICALPV